MKLTNALQTLLLSTIILFCGTACNNENDERISSTGEVVMKGEANSIEIPMSRSNWMVSSVVYLDGGIAIDENGYPLELEGMGSIRFLWGSITHNQDNALIVQVDDNVEWEERGIIINLGITKGIYREQLIIRQKPWEGYHFKSLTYSLEPEDGEREIQSKEYRLVFNNRVEWENIIIYPYDNMYERYQFFSEDPAAFSWIRDENPWVNGPSTTGSGEIQISPRPFIYTQSVTQRDCDLKEESLVIQTPPHKQTIITVNVRYMMRQVSYTLTLEENLTQVERRIKGKLIQEYPFDCTSRTEVNELPSGNQ